MVATLRLERKTHKDLKAILRRLEGQGPKRVKAGFPSGKASSDVINKAVWNNFGTSRGIPARPFMQNAIQSNAPKYKQLMRDAAKSLLTGTSTMAIILPKLGALLASDIQMEITSGSFAPNAPATIKRKGSSKPLIDTGEMRGSVTWALDQ